MIDATTLSFAKLGLRVYDKENAAPLEDSQYS